MQYGEFIAQIAQSNTINPAQKICDSCKKNLRFYVKSSVQHNKSCPVMSH